MKLYRSQVGYTFKKVITEKHAKKPFLLRFTSYKDDSILFEKFYPTYKGASAQGKKLSRTEELWDARWTVVETSSEYFFREFGDEQRTAIVRDAGYTILDAWDPVSEFGIPLDTYFVWARAWGYDNEQRKKVFKFNHVSAHPDGDFTLSVTTNGSGYSVLWETVQTAWDNGEIQPLGAYDFDKTLAEYTGAIDTWVNQYKDHVNGILDKARTFETLEDLQEYARDNIDPVRGAAPGWHTYLVNFEDHDVLYRIWDKANDDVRNEWTTFREALNDIAVELTKKSAETLPDTTPREKMLKAFATVGYAPPVEKYLDKIVTAIEQRDAQGVYDVAHPTNKATRLGFTNITGVKLGRTRKEDLTILTAWAQGAV